MLELLAGVLVTLAALALVVEPLFIRRSGPIVVEHLDVVDLEDAESPKIQALLTLREIEFDHATGKLTDDDYTRLKTKYEALALHAIRGEQATAPPDDADEAEALIRAAAGDGAKHCAHCGPRPESNAAFCSQCGRALNVPDAQPRCTVCATPLPDDAKFCAGCGVGVAA